MKEDKDVLEAMEHFADSKPARADRLEQAEKLTLELYGEGNGESDHSHAGGVLAVSRKKTRVLTLALCGAALLLVVGILLICFLGKPKDEILYFDDEAVYSDNIADIEQFIDEIQNAYTHYIVSEKHKDNGSLALKLPSLALAAEVGVDLDEWLAAKPPRRRRGMRRPKRTFRQLLHYRASLFVDYGLLSLNDYEGNLAASRPINVSNASSQTGHLSVFKEGTPDLQGMNTVLSTDGAVNSLLNPLTVGVKFTVSYEFEKPDPPRRPRPKPKPKPKPQPKQIPPVPPVYMCGVVLNGETRAALDSASVEIYDVTGETALFLDTTKTDGMFHTKLEAGTYSGYIRRPGYLPYTGEFTYVEGDTVYILLQEIKKDIVTLLDVHFATNKTVVLPESAQTLEDLYDFLSENQTVRIKIIGHTDSVGSDESNQRLSEGRAKSVRNEMIRRGIDASRIEFEGKGEMAPIATNETEEGRAQNRRVEFIILSE